MPIGRDPQNKLCSILRNIESIDPTRYISVHIDLDHAAATLRSDKLLLVRLVQEKPMSTLSQILRSITLSILFGGAGMITFAAITLVRAAREKGMSVADAAMNNSPIFLNFSTIALACAVILIIAELLDFVKDKQNATKLSKARWATSLISAVAAMVFSLGIVPPMKTLIPDLRSSEEAHAKFDALHKSSEKVFGVMMLFALASLLLPAFDKPKKFS